MQKYILYRRAVWKKDYKKGFDGYGIFTNFKSGKFYEIS